MNFLISFCVCIFFFFFFFYDFQVSFYFVLGKEMESFNFISLPVYFSDISVYRTFHVNKDFFSCLFVGNTDDDSFRN